MVTYYYSDGQKELEGYHILNRRAGMWRGWHEDGSQSFRSEYRDGELYRWKQYRHDGTDQTYSRAKTVLAGDTLGRWQGRCTSVR